jgi:hypothetical protein
MRWCTLSLPPELCGVEHGEDAGELSAGVGTVMASSHAVDRMTAEQDGGSQTARDHKRQPP